MVNAGFRILLLLLQENNVNDKFPIISNLNSDPISWRTMIAKYFDESEEKG